MNPAFLVHTNESIQVLLARELAAVTDLLSVSSDEALLLLNACEWSKAKLEEEWFADGSGQALRERAGAPVPVDREALLLAADGSVFDAVEMEDFPISECVSGLKRPHLCSRVRASVS